MVSLELSIAKTGAKLVTILKEAQLVAGTSAAYRMIDQQAVRVNGERVTDRELALKPGAEYLLQVGKRAFARVTLREMP